MYSVSYGDKQIKFNIKRKNVKNINLTVKPNLEVSVSANNQVPLEYIKKFVYSKADWIEKHLNYYKNTQDIDKELKEYISGESFRYLGKQYRLKVFHSFHEEVKYFRGYIHLCVKDLDDLKKKKRLMEDWYREKSKIIFRQSLDRMYKLVKPYGVNYPELNIRKMKSRWGSCYINRNKIILNSVLVKAPKSCIDYVTLHELIHFIYKDHGKDFYRLLNILMPDWKEKKEILDKVIIKELGE